MNRLPSLHRWLDRLRGLKAQIVLWTVLPLSLVLIGVAFTGVYSHEQTMRVLVGDRDRALATIAAGQVRDTLDRRVRALQTLAGDPTLRSGDAAARQQAVQAATRALGPLLGADGLALVDADGLFLDVGNHAVATSGVSSVLPAFATAVQARQAALGRLILMPDGRESILLLGVPVSPGETSGTWALVDALPLGALRLQDVLQRVEVGEHAIVYVADSGGRLLARAPGADSVLLLHANHEASLAAALGTGATATIYDRPDGERMSLAYAPVGAYELDLFAVVEQPWHEVVGSVLRYSQFVPLVAGLAVIVSLLTLYLGVRSIVQPLQALGQQAEQVAWGDFAATRKPVGGVREIEELRQTLDQMARRIQSYQSSMHDYIAAMTQGQEEERRRLARELHDDTAQSLIALGQGIERAQKALPAGAEPAAERLSAVRAMLAETLEGVRRFSRDLRPTYLDDLGFIPALEMLVRPDGRTDVVVELETSGSVRRLLPDLELAAYRIVQEALNNVYQHARASHAWVRAGFEAGGLALSVRDDGQGFDAAAARLPGSLAKAGHLGLMGIQERALLYGGKVTIESSPGRGTTVSAYLPYPNDGEQAPAGEGEQG